MKKIIAGIMLCLFIATSAGAVQVSCTVTEVITPILPEGYGHILVECKNLKNIAVGDKVKIKTKKSAAVEGC